VILKTGEKLNQSSNSKQAEFNKEVEARAGRFISSSLKDKIAEALGKVCEILPDAKDNHVLLIKFPRVFDYAYIRQNITWELWRMIM
jgi:hypothetical protein